MKTKKLSVISISLYVVAMLLAAFVGYAFYCNISNKVAFIGNKAVVRIVSPSMETEIMTGDYILLEKVNPKELEIGDVIAFYSVDPDIYGMINTHRIENIEPDTDGNRLFTTKGDNNESVDNYKVKETQIVAKYKRVLPGVTFIGKLFSNQIVFLLLVLVPCGLIAAFSIVDIVKKKKEPTKEERIQQELEKLKQSGELDELINKVKKEIENETIQKDSTQERN